MKSVSIWSDGEIIQDYNSNIFSAFAESELTDNINERKDEGPQEELLLVFGEPKRW